MGRNYFLCLLGILACFISNTAAIEAIVGGEKAAPNQFPYQVSIRSHGVSHNCGGGIIGEYFILSAAHCVLDHVGRFLNTPISVIAGTHDRLTPGAVIAVKKIYVLKDYNVLDALGPNDISILRMNHSLPNSSFSQRLRLARNKRELYDGKPAIIAGFGWTWSYVENHREIGGFNDSFLRYGDSRVLNQSLCQHYYPNTVITFVKMCAHMRQFIDPSRPRGTCIGDSGGPLVYNNRTVIGVFTTGPASCNEAIRPALYTRVSHFLTFINNAMKDKVTRKMRSQVLIP